MFYLGNICCGWWLLPGGPGVHAGAGSATVPEREKDEGYWSAGRVQ